MSWRDTMRLRRRADWLRGAAWANTLLSIAAAASIHDSDFWIAVGAWLCVSTLLLFGLARLVDKRATRIVGR